MIFTWTHLDGKAIHMEIDPTHVGSYVSLNGYMRQIAITKNLPYGKPAFVLEVCADGTLQGVGMAA